jgi:hypothetical protein
MNSPLATRYSLPQLTIGNILSFRFEIPGVTVPKLLLFRRGFMRPTDLRLEPDKFARTRQRESFERYVPRAGRRVVQNSHGGN